MKKSILSLMLLVIFIVTMSFVGIGCKEEAKEEVAEETAAAEEEEEAEEPAAAEEEEEAEEPAAEEEKVVIGIDVKTLDNPYFVDVLDGAKEECDKRGWELIDVQCANDPELQQSLIEDFVSKEVDAIVMLTSTDPETSRSLIESAIEANIPVIGLDSGILGSNVTIYGCDNIVDGEKQSQYIIDNIGEEGMVCILEGIPGQSTAMDRTQGNMNILEKYSGITTTVQNANWSMEDGLTTMEDLLQTYDKIDAVTCGNDLMALGAVAAVEAAGRLDEILIVGWDGVTDAINSIKEGKLGATVWVDAKELGAQGVVIAEKILNGEEFDFIEREYDWGTEKAILLETIIVTRENVNEYF